MFNTVLALSAMLLTIAGIAIVILFSFDFSNETFRGFKKATMGVVLMLVCFLAAYCIISVVVIEAGDRGVIFNVGSGVKLDNVLGEGWHVVPKIVNHVTIYDVYTKTWTETINCLSSDGLPINCDVSIRYRINPASVANVKQNVGNEGDIVDKILVPTARSKMRDISATYTAQEAYAHKRMELQNAYKCLLEEFFAEEEYLLAEQILIREVIPPKDLIAEIQKTKVAEQAVIRKKNELEQAKMDKEKKIVQAEADAESLRIRGREIAKSPQILAKERIEKWNGELPVTMLSDSGGIIINLEKIMEKK